MRFSMILLGAAVAILPALAEELRPSGVPSQCKTICEPIVKLSNTCDIDPEEITSDNDKRRSLSRRQSEGVEGGEENDETVEAECICRNTSFDVENVMALCASCLSQNGGETEDADRIMSQCSFSSASYSPAATTAVQDVQVLATKPAEPTGAAGDNGESGAGKVVAKAAAALGVSVALFVMF